MSTKPAHRGAGKRCLRKGHKWRQKVMYVLGDDVCARWGCTAERINPGSLPPEGWLGNPVNRI